MSGAADSDTEISGISQQHRSSSSGLPLVKPAVLRLVQHSLVKLNWLRNKNYCSVVFVTTFEGRCLCLYNDTEIGQTEQPPGPGLRRSPIKLSSASSDLRSDPGAGRPLTLISDSQTLHSLHGAHTVLGGKSSKFHFSSTKYFKLLTFSYLLLLFAIICNFWVTDVIYFISTLL